MFFDSNPLKEGMMQVSITANATAYRLQGKKNLFQRKAFC